MSQQDGRQRARRDRREGLTGPGRVRRDRERRAEQLLAQVLDALAQRDALVAELEARAGRSLEEIRSLGWPSAHETAEACGLTVREAKRLRDLAQCVASAASTSVAAPIVDGPTRSEQRSASPGRR